MTDWPHQKTRDAAFSFYLRTGRRLPSLVQPAPTETKFNPWHDPEDGRFTFSGRGQFFGAGSRSDGRAAGSSREARNTATRPSGAGPALPQSNYDIKKELADPRYASTYTVRPGDNLSRIAASRKGLSVNSLAWVNGIPVNGTLRVGQKLRIPTQAWLDANKIRARGTIGRVAAAEIYLGTHNGKLPIPRSPDDPNFRDIDTAHPPSISEQTSAKVATIELNGYRYSTDMLGRVRNVHGEIPAESTQKRSRSAQARAGGKDRLPTDDGGHYIAPRFGGEPVAINHFPQDSGINRGQYRAIEDQWDKARKAGKRVIVDITPHYSGASLRPDQLDVVWYVDGKRYEQRVGNQRRR